MRVAFAIVSYFAGGGLQRDCIRLARRIMLQGHEVVIFASRSDGHEPSDLRVELLPNRALTNHGRNSRFAKSLQGAVHPFDCVVGFDKLPGLDLLYCADPSQAERKGSALVRLTPRHRALMAQEKACFGVNESTHIILLSEKQLDEYFRAWKTPRSRLSVIPPTIDRDRCKPCYRSDGTREKMRDTLGVAPDDWLWLSVGAYPYTKGFDRPIAMLAEFPNAKHIILGIDPVSRQGRALTRKARRHGVAERVSFLGYHEDVPAIMAAADIFVHPARQETTGTAILEAVVNGLPVIVTDNCGYAVHVGRAEAGIVISTPYSRHKLAEALAVAGISANAQAWSANGTRYGAREDLYGGLDEAARIIVEKLGQMAGRRRS